MFLLVEIMSLNHLNSQPIFFGIKSGRSQPFFYKKDRLISLNRMKSHLFKSCKVKKKTYETRAEAVLESYLQVGGNTPLSL